MVVRFTDEESSCIFLCFRDARQPARRQAVEHIPVNLWRDLLARIRGKNSILMPTVAVIHIITAILVLVHSINWRCFYGNNAIIAG